MLKKILIKDYILIDNLELEFSDKLNIITGETGSGKSILIGAIDVVFGAKVSKECIKNGAEKAYIELSLFLKSPINRILEENGIENFGNELVISKEITQSGSRSRVNGTLVNQDFIKLLRDKFLDIHSQHQTYSFMQPKYHIHLLDSYAKSTCANLFAEYSNLYEEYTNTKQALENAKNANTLTENQIDFLKFQIDEIESAEIKDINEDKDLEQELAVLDNAEKLKELTGSASWSINNDDDSILSALVQIKMNISKAARMDSNLETTESELLDIIESLKDLSSSLRDYSQNLDNDTERLNNIQERLFNLDKLKRKYGNTLEDVLNTYTKLQQEYSAIENYSNNIEELEIKLSNLKTKLTIIATEISEKRKQYSEVLSSLIVEKLEKLELPKVQFKIDVQETDINRYGMDNVEFLITTNVSEPLRPLAKVASGGEISRVMLALKTIFAQHDNVDTVIFDEIDTGISGKTSQKVAEEISELANYRQIIMITHQAIIASKADKHIYVKKVQGDSTQVGIYILNESDRLNALAELAGGEITDKSLEFAKTLIN
ncbi:MAG: DNA repair protein RecN [Candidatus Gastranaerophilaceae bacterium]